jgi:hypothetical protein
MLLKTARRWRATSASLMTATERQAEDEFENLGNEDSWNEERIRNKLDTSSTPTFCTEAARIKRKLDRQLNGAEHKILHGSGQNRSLG